MTADLDYLACIHEVTRHVSRQVDFLFREPAVAGPLGMPSIVKPEVLASFAEGLLDFPEVSRGKTCGFATLCCSRAVLGPDLGSEKK